jgi:hypothetical protein
MKKNRKRKRDKYNDRLKKKKTKIERNEKRLELENDFLKDGFKKEGNFFVISKDELEKNEINTENILPKPFSLNEKSNIPNDERSRIENNFISDGFVKEGNLFTTTDDSDVLVEVPIKDKFYVL